jgi:DNA polymerase-1
MASKYEGNVNNKFLQLPNGTVASYNSWDCRSTAELFFALRSELQDPALGGQWKYYEEWIQPLQHAVIAMYKRGLLLDKDKKAKLQGAMTRELTAADQDIRKFARGVGFTFTDKFPNAPGQVGALLFDHLGLRGGKQTPKSKQWQSDQEALTRALRQLRKRDEEARPLLHQLFHRSRLETVKGRYFNLPVDPDGRVRPRVKMTGTKTFRYAYAEPPVQQHPPEIREVFVASPGKVLVSIDYSQLEARILAILANDETSLRTFAEGGDVHDQNARDLFGLDQAEWEALGSRAKARRNFAKTFLYGISYGGDADSMKTKLFCPCPKCEHLVPQTVDLTRPQIAAAAERWFQAHPAVPKWQRELCETVRRSHFYQSPFGLRRWISQPWGSDLERQVKNLPMQMNAALLMNQAQVKLHREAAPIVLQMHDAFLFEVPEAQVDQLIATARGIMESPVAALGGHSFPVDVEVGRNWGSYAEDNPDGLRKVA